MAHESPLELSVSGGSPRGIRKWNSSHQAAAPCYFSLFMYIQWTESYTFVLSLVILFYMFTEGKINWPFNAYFFLKL